MRWLHPGESQVQQAAAMLESLFRRWLPPAKRRKLMKASHDISHFTDVCYPWNKEKQKTNVVKKLRSEIQQLSKNYGQKSNNCWKITVRNPTIVSWLRSAIQQLFPNYGQQSNNCYKSTDRNPTISICYQITDTNPTLLLDLWRSEKLSFSAHLLDFYGHLLN